MRSPAAKKIASPGFAPTCAAIFAASASAAFSTAAFAAMIAASASAFALMLAAFANSSDFNFCKSRFCYGDFVIFEGNFFNGYFPSGDFVFFFCKRRFGNCHFVIL